MCGVQVAVTGVDEAKGKLWFGEGGIGCDSGLVGGCGCGVVAGVVWASSVLLGEAEVVEDVGVPGLGSGEGLQGRDGGGVVAVLEGGFGGADLGVDGLLRGGCIGLAGSGGKVLCCGGGGEQDREEGGSGVRFCIQWLDPLPRQKVCKVFQKKDLGSDLSVHLKYGSPVLEDRANRESLYR